MNAKTAEILIRCFAINAEIEAMKAENKTRESRGYSLAYNGEAFQKMASQLEDHANRLNQFWHDGIAQ